SVHRLFQRARGENGFKVPHANSLAIQLLQETLCIIRQERLLNGRLQLCEFILLLNLDRCLLEAHRYCTLFRSLPDTSGLWSGRRESNPRPTAWKAVTLPLSYSRHALSCQLSAVSPQQNPPFKLWSR